MRLKYFREQKYEARGRLFGREETFDVDNEEDWNDFMLSNGYVRPCKLERRWNSFVSWFWTILILVPIVSIFVFIVSSVPPLGQMAIIVAMIVFIFTWNR